MTKPSDDILDTMHNFNIDNWLLNLETEEESKDMHYSLYSIPKYYQEGE